MPLNPTTVTSIDSVILAAVLVFLLLLGFNAGHIARIFKSFFRDIWSIRERENVFEQHLTSETHILLLLLLLTSVLEGLMLACYLFPALIYRTLEPFLLCIGMALVFNAFSVAACTTVGYTFTTPVMAMQWRRGLFASQAMLGLMLIIPTVLMLLHPRWIETATYIAVVLYVMARLLYIAKGTRIFFDNSLSWLYFILYLCTLEIIPLLVVWRFLKNVSF